MTEIEKIFEKYSKQPVKGQVIAERFEHWAVPMTMNSEQFKAALAEVFELVKVTDGVIDYYCDIDNDTPDFKLGAKWSRDLQQNKLEKLLR